MLSLSLTATFCLLLLLVNSQPGVSKRLGPELSPEKKEQFAGSLSSASSRVIGGTDAVDGEAPYQVSLQGTLYNDHMCGGAIINKDWVLTAAHCVYGYNPPYLQVATGSIRWAQPEARYQVKEYYVHCNYNFPNYHNDIALIHLNESIVFNEYTQPAPLPTEPLVDGAELVLTGWGSTELWGDTPDVLQRANLTYVEYNRCQEIMGGDDNNGICHICTLTDEGRGACHGDSGGPLTWQGILVGLVNWGYPCAIGYPDSFASVYFNKDWISRVTSGTCDSTCHCYASNYPSL
ncbi:chymotrypsin-2 [Drosophila tropicalis]|uniref:chymotrypsin-2 n=1 Tax=Drosophila tropicalis TaxID=46794 RepID=UPI0035AB73C1